MNYKKLIAVAVILAVLCSFSSVAFASNPVIVIGTETTTVTETTTTVTETTDGGQTGEGQSTESQTPESSTGETQPSQQESGTGETGTSTEQPAPSPEAGTSDGSDLAPDEINPTIVKHPGDELGHSVGDNILFTAACTNTQSVTWFIDTPTETGIAATDIINHLKGVSAVETPTTVNGVQGSQITIMGLTNECNNIRVYAQFNITNGQVLTSNAARITVRGAENAVASPTPAPTQTPAPTPTPTPAPTATPNTATASAPAQTSQQTAPANSGALSSAPVENASEEQSADDAASEKLLAGSDAVWSVPGAKTSVAACAAVAIAALVIMILYSTGAIELRGLERLVGGRKASDFDEDDE
ncbi:MAG: hypothetical protein Q4F31_03775 [Eubacteriales bacterium]|nr:hypothetical protein [Eubacteriales bacterium]